MSFQRVRALVPVRHDGVVRIPGITSGENGQDFVVRTEQATRLIAQGLVSFIEAAEPPATGLEQVFVGSDGVLRRPGGGVVGGRGIGTQPTTILFGDSITANQTDAAFGILPAAWFMIGNALVGAPWRIVRNAGIGFNRSSQMLARMDADVLAFESQAVDVMGGTNDIYLDNASADAVINNLRQIYERLVAAGRYVRAYTILPRGGAGASMTLGQRVLTVNRWIMSYWVARSGGEAIDVYGPYADHASTTGAPLTNVTDDQIHPNNRGAYLIAERIASRLDLVGGAFVAVNTLPESVIDDTAIDATAAQYIRNPMCTGTDGTLQSGNTGQSPSHTTMFTGTGAVTTVNSVVAAPDGVGQAHRIVYSSSAAGFGVGQLAMSTVPPGTYVMEAQFRVAANPVNFAGFGLRCQRTNGGSYLLLYPSTTGQSLPITRDTIITLRSLPFPIVAGDNPSVQFAAAFNAASGSATIDRCKVTLRPLLP